MTPWGLTRDDDVILALPTDQQLDILVAEKVHRQKRVGECPLGTLGTGCPGQWRPALLKFGGCLPGYSARWDEACTVVEPVVRAGFTSRRLFLAALRQQVQTKTRRQALTDRIDWPDVLFFLTPDMLCRAALIALKGKTHEAQAPPVEKPA